MITCEVVDIGTNEEEYKKNNEQSNHNPIQYKTIQILEKSIEIV
jgi:hypothetical protein